MSYAAASNRDVSAHTTYIERFHFHNHKKRCTNHVHTPYMYTYLLRVLFRVKSYVPAVIVSKLARAIVWALVAGKQGGYVLE